MTFVTHTNVTLETILEGSDSEFDSEPVFDHPLTTSMINDIIGITNDEMSHEKDQSNEAIMQFLKRLEDKLDTSLQRVDNNEKRIAEISVKSDTEIYAIKEYIKQSQTVQLENVSQLQNEIKTLERKVNELEDRRQDSMHLHYAVTCTETLLRENIRFNGEITTQLHPMEFLSNLQCKFETFQIPTSQQLGVAVQCLTGSALLWYQENVVHNFDEFKTAFQKQYWSEVQQQRLIEYIYTGQYRPVNCGGQINMTMYNYATRIISQTKHLTNQGFMSEELLISCIIKHLPPAIRILLTQIPLNKKSLLDTVQKLDNEPHTLQLLKCQEPNTAHGNGFAHSNNNNSGVQGNEQGAAKRN